VISPTQRPVPDDAQHSQETDIHALAGYEHAKPASEGSQNHALDRAETGTGTEPDASAK